MKKKELQAELQAVQQENVEIRAEVREEIRAEVTPLLQQAADELDSKEDLVDDLLGILSCYGYIELDREEDPEPEDRDQGIDPDLLLIQDRRNAGAIPPVQLGTQGISATTAPSEWIQVNFQVEDPEPVDTRVLRALEIWLRLRAQDVLARGTTREWMVYHQTQREIVKLRAEFTAESGEDS